MTVEKTSRRIPRLYLVAPAGDAAKLAATLPAVLDAADVAAVLLHLPQDDEAVRKDYVRALAPLAQQRGSAVLLDGRASLVKATGADGAHLTGIGEIKDVLDELKPDRIVGAGGLGSRHDAMVAAEAGADYVMFGEPDSQGRRPGLDAICERVKWWADLFETPCVGYAADEKEASALAAAGADFVAVGEFVVNGAQPAATIRTVARMLSSSETVS